MRLKKYLFLSILFSLSAFFFFAAEAGAEGASFYFAPSTGSYEIGAEFSVTVMANTVDQAINAAEGALRFDAGKVEIKSVEVGDSIFNFWVPRRPVFSNTDGTLTFGGGLPKPGYQGKAGNLLTIIFKAKAAGDAGLSFTSGAILANDEKSSNILTAMGSGNYRVLPKTLAPKEDEKSPADKMDGEVKKDEKKESALETAGTGTLSLTNSFIKSSSHPDQSAWYHENKAVFSWELPAGTEAVSMTFSNSVNADPGTKGAVLATEKVYENIKDGVWYFVLRIKSGGNWSEPYRYRVQIDTTKPEPIMLSVRQDDPEDWPTLVFKSDDKGSGLLKYDIKIGSLEERGYTMEPKAETMIASNLEAGDHTAIVKAIDQAGNYTLAEVNFSIPAIDPPTIESVPNEIKTSDKAFISGKSRPDMKIHIFIEDENGRTIARMVESDKSGAWHLILDESLKNGRYVAWAVAENANGLKSNPSNKPSFLVTPPVFMRLGTVVINYFTVFASLLFIIVLIVFMVVTLAGFLRKRLKKETIEAEKVLIEKIEELKREIDRELSLLKSEPSEKARARARVNKKINTAADRIMKEVKDVEKILK